MSKVTNENLEKLKVLSEELCNLPSDKHKGIVKKIKAIFEEGKKELEGSNSVNSKLKCYEKMCESITSILISINI